MISNLRPARYALISEHLTAATAQRGLCAFASDWLRSARERACPPDGAACTELETRLAVTQITGGGAGVARLRSVACDG